MDTQLRCPQEEAKQPAHFSAHVYCGQMVTRLSNCWALVEIAQHLAKLWGTVDCLMYPVCWAVSYWKMKNSLRSEECRAWQTSGRCNVQPLETRRLSWPNGLLDQDATWYGGICLGPGHIVLHGDPAHHPPNGTQPPQFLAHVCYGQTAGWVKMPLGMEAGLRSGLC